MNDAEFIGRVNVLVAQEIKENCKDKKQIKPNEIELSQSAMVTIGMAIKQIAREMYLDEYEIKKRMTTEVYELNGDLIFIFYIPEIEADCIVSIPFGYWNYINREGVQ
jgi:hypothetical protein